MNHSTLDVQNVLAFLKSKLDFQTSDWDSEVLDMTDFRQDICQNLPWLYFCFTKIAKYLWFLKKIELNSLSSVVTYEQNTIIPFKNLENI